MFGDGLDSDRLELAVGQFDLVHRRRDRPGRVRGPLLQPVSVAPAAIRAMAPIAAPRRIDGVSKRISVSAGERTSYSITGRQRSTVINRNSGWRAWQLQGRQGPARQGA
jgi:hypothetical protein